MKILNLESSIINQSIMPITKQTIKRVKQAEAARKRNRHYSSRMKSMMKLLLGYVKNKDSEKATKILSDVVSSIDTAAKKRLIHKNKAKRDKSKVQRAVNGLSPKKTASQKEAA